MISKLEKLLGPIANKLAQQRHLQAISSGMMMSLGLIVVGSVFLIIANPPINLDLADLNTGNICYKMKASVYGIISMCTFLMVAAPLKDGAITMSYLGADGLFVALIISLISVEISRVVSHRIVFTFPDSVPSAVTNFVNSLMPLALNNSL